LFESCRGFANSADGAVQCHQERAHQVVVAGLLHSLEEPFHQGFMTIGVERQRKVFEQQLPGDGTRIGEPARREAAEALGVVNAAQLADERGVAALETVPQSVRKSRLTWIAPGQSEVYRRTEQTASR